MCKYPVTKGTTPTTYGYNFDEDGEINFVKIEDINSEFNIGNNLDRITKECNAALSRSELRENDILFSIAGTIGRIGVVNAKILPANTNQALAIIRLKDEYIKIYNFILYSLKCDYIKQQYISSQIGSNRNNLSLEDVQNMKIRFPKQEKIDKILEFINKTEKEISEINKKIEISYIENEKLIKEYFY